MRQLLSQITLERCGNSSSSALVCPDADILPVRSVYNGATQNIGIKCFERNLWHYLTSKEPIWFAGPDIIASILLTGKVPQIEKAIRVVPRGQ